jgi:hypothetical protein
MTKKDIEYCVKEIRNHLCSLPKDYRVSTLWKLSEKEVYWGRKRKLWSIGVKLIRKIKCRAK